MIKLRNVFLVGCLFVFALGAYLYAQKPASEQLISQNPEYNALATKLDFLSDKLEKSNAELSAKLDKVLANQQKILDELVIVKVRATRK